MGAWLALKADKEDNAFRGRAEGHYQTKRLS